MTLLELMVTVSIISLVSSGTALYAIHHYKTAQKQTATAAARTIRAATQHYLLDHRSCPTVDELIEARLIDRGSETRDPWKGKYYVTCPDGDVMVASRGPDKREWTEDDILIPDLSHLADPFDEDAPFLESPDMAKGLSLEEWLGDARPLAVGAEDAPEDEPDLGAPEMASEPRE